MWSRTLDDYTLIKYRFQYLICLLINFYATYAFQIVRKLNWIPELKIISSNTQNSRVTVLVTKLLQNGWIDLYEILCAYWVDLRTTQHLFVIPLNNNDDLPLTFLLCVFFKYGKTKFAFALFVFKQIVNWEISMDFSIIFDVK